MSDSPYHPRDLAQGRFAMAQGWLSRDQATALLDQAQQQGVSLAEAGLRSGWLSREAAERLHQLRADQRLLNSSAVSYVHATPPSNTPSGHTPSGFGARATLPERGTSLGDYRIERELGRGGMGAVFVARHTALDTCRALKVSLFASDASTRAERFAREARALAKLPPHPGVVRVYEYGVQQGLAYCALDLIEGHDLDHELAQGPLPPERVARLCADLARALAHVHAHGVVHRDLKPGNVLISNDDDRPRLTDFGIARDESEERLTRTQQIVGTPQYMSPEQALGEVRKIGPWTDVFALGVVAVELLTGARPFEGSTLLELVGEICEADPPSLRGVATPDLEGWIHAALAKAPEQRPAAEDLARAFDAVARGERAPPPRAGWTRRLRSRRVRWALAVSAGLVVVASPVGLWLRWEAARSDWEHEARAVEEDVDATWGQLTARALELGFADVAPVDPQTATALHARAQDVPARHLDPGIVERAHRARTLAAALSAFAAGEAEAARRHAEALEELAGWCVLAELHCADPDARGLEAVEGWAARLRERPRAQALMELRAARLATQLGELDRASRALERLPEDVDGAVQTWAKAAHADLVGTRAVALARHAQWEEARERLRVAVALDPAAAKPHVDAASVLAAQGEIRPEASALVRWLVERGHTLPHAAVGALVQGIYDTLERQAYLEIWPWIALAREVDETFVIDPDVMTVLSVGLLGDLYAGDYERGYEGLLMLVRAGLPVRGAETEQLQGLREGGWLDRGVEERPRDFAPRLWRALAEVDVPTHDPARRRQAQDDVAWVLAREDLPNAARLDARFLQAMLEREHDTEQFVARIQALVEDDYPRAARAMDHLSGHLYDLGQFARAARWAERSVLLEVDDMRGGVTQRDQWSTARSWAERNEALDDTLSRWMRCCERLDDAAQAQRILDLAAEWGLNDELVEHLEDLGP